MTRAERGRAGRGWVVLRLTGFTGAVALAGGAWAVVAGGAGVPGLAVAVAGVGLVVLAWVLAAHAVLAGAPPPPGWSARTVALWGAPVACAPPLFSKDVYSYLAQGAVGLTGADPHVVAPSAVLAPDSPVLARVDSYWRDTPSPYGPVTDGVQQAVAALGGDGALAGVALHRLVAVLALAVVVAVLPRLAAVTGVGAETALVLGALSPLVLFHLVGGVHNDGPMLALMLAGTAAALHGVGRGARAAPAGWAAVAWVTAGVLLVASAVLVKAPAVVALAVVAVLVARRVGGVRGAGVAVVGTGAGLAAVVGAAALLDGHGLSWLAATVTPATLGSWLAPTNWAGFAAGGGPALAASRTAGLALAVVVVAVVLARQLRGRLDPVTALGAALGAVVVLGPVVHPWYVLWAVTPLAAARLRPRPAAVLVGLVAVLAVVLPPTAGDFSGRVAGLVAAYAVAVAVVAAAYAALRGAGGPSAPWRAAGAPARA